MKIAILLDGASSELGVLPEHDEHDAQGYIWSLEGEIGFESGLRVFADADINFDNRSKEYLNALRVIEPCGDDFESTRWQELIKQIFIAGLRFGMEKADELRARKIKFPE